MERQPSIGENLKPRKTLKLGRDHCLIKVLLITGLKLEVVAISLILVLGKGCFAILIFITTSVINSDDRRKLEAKCASENFLEAHLFPHSS